MANLPDLCRLEHSIFALPEAVFRRGQDGTPVMAVPMGGSTACLALHALRNEFNIEPGSGDGRMLTLVVDALDFVAGLRIGDPLPAEVLTGDASWSAGPRHRAAADRRLKRRLVGWLAAMEGEGGNPADDAVVPAELNRALAAAASASGLPGPAAVLSLVEAIAAELSFVEDLRETLLGRARLMQRKIVQMGVRRAPDAVQAASLAQVQQLADTALRQLAARFEEVDARTDQVIALLRAADGTSAFIRSTRDWLYRSSRAWSPLLEEWAGLRNLAGDAAGDLLGRTYAFLAPRHMSVTEWDAAGRHATAPRRVRAAMQW